MSSLVAIETKIINRIKANYFVDREVGERDRAYFFERRQAVGMAGGSPWGLVKVPRISRIGQAIRQIPYLPGWAMFDGLP